MSTAFDKILRAAQQLSPTEQRELAAQLLAASEHSLDAGADELLGAENGAPSDEVCRQRLAWIKAHREEYAGQYVALDGDVLVGVGPTIRVAHEQARRQGVAQPFLMRVTSERETLSAGLL